MKYVKNCSTIHAIHFILLVISVTSYRSFSNFCVNVMFGCLRFYISIYTKRSNICLVIISFFYNFIFFMTSTVRNTGDIKLLYVAQFTSNTHSFVVIQTKTSLTTGVDLRMKINFQFFLINEFYCL